MTNLKLFDPNEVDESLVKFVEFSGKHYVLLPFVDATAGAPEYRSVGHVAGHDSLKLEDLDRISKAMQQRAQDAVWFILFNMPWLLRRSDAEEIRRPGTTRR